MGKVFKTPCLFYFQSVKFHQRYCSISAKKTTKEIRLCQDLMTINTDSYLKVHALHYANEVLVLSGLFRNFFKLAKQAQTIRNCQKQVSVVINHFWETHKLTRYQNKEFSYITFLYSTNVKAYAYN